MPAPTMRKAEALDLAHQIWSDMARDGVTVRASVERGWRAYMVEVTVLDSVTRLWQDGAICGADVHLGTLYTPDAYTPERRAAMARAGRMTVAERRATFEAQR